MQYNPEAINTKPSKNKLSRWQRNPQQIQIQSQSSFEHVAWEFNKPLETKSLQLTRLGLKGWVLLEKN